MIEPREPRHPRIPYHHFIKQPTFMKIGIQLSIDINNLPKRVQSKLKRADLKGTIQFRGEEWTIFNMGELSARIVRWEIPKALNIQSTKQPTLLKQISNIDFSSLINMNLSGNGIESIQSICSIMMPNLERLVLSNNKISSIKSLRKAWLPKLLSCSLGGNRVLEYEALCQLQAPQLTSVSQQNRADRGWCNTFSWIGKLQTNQLERLWVSSDKRIWQKSAQNSFERKYLKRKEITFYVGLGVEVN